MPDDQEKNPTFSVLRAMRDVSGRDQKLITQEGTTRVAGKKEIQPGESAGVTPAQALESERPPKKDEGERAFGAPLSTPPPQKKKEDAEEKSK